MSPSPPVHSTLVLLLLLAFAAHGLQAGDSGSQDNFAGSFFTTSSPSPLKQFPTFESINPVPAIIDPFHQDIILVLCQVSAEKHGQPVKGARGKFKSELYVLDNTSGTFATFDVGSGKFKTNSHGFDRFEFDLPPEFFADGFESGDVSAWSYTRTDFTSKKGTHAIVICDTLASK